MLIYFKYILSSISKLKIENSKLKIPAKQAGFTLTELMVVITIATILMTALIFKQNNWNDRLSVTTQTYDLALMIRQAQIYSLGVREYQMGSGDKFNIGYGVAVGVLAPNQYTFFADADKDLKNDAGETLETKIFTRGVTVQKVCGTVAFFGEVCSNDFLSFVRRIDISFFRPEVSAKAKFLDSNQNEIMIFGTPVYNFPAKIYLRSTGGKISSVTIEANGQVSIQ